MGFNHGIFLGSRQLTILIPWPPFLTLRLWDAIHSLTSLEMCQEALSQINTHTFLPVAASFSEHHERKRVVMPLTGLPSTKRSHTSSKRRGSPASLQLWREGLAKRLHQVSSRKPTTQSGRLLARRISRSRRLFFSRTRDRGCLSSAWLAASAPRGAPGWPGRSHRLPDFR